MKARLITIGESEIRKQVAEEFDFVYNDMLPHFLQDFWFILSAPYPHQFYTRFSESSYSIQDCIPYQAHYNP